MVMKLLAPALVRFPLPTGVPTKAATAATNGHSLLFVRLVSRVVCWLIEWRKRAVQRRTLAMLDDHMLKDIGLSRMDVEREISRPFWHYW
jgi:uncharacterized protein YjiS (DUF1127 family)